MLTGDSSILLDRPVYDLSSTFSMKNLGDLHYLFGVDVTRISNGIFLSQKKHVSDLLDRALVSQCNPVATPMPSKEPAIKNGDKLYDSPTYFLKFGGCTSISHTD